MAEVARPDGQAADETEALVARALADPPLTLRCKVLILGDSTVGKTALATVFHGGVQSYSKNYNMTVGIDLLVKTVQIPDTSVNVELYIVDCGGFNGISHDLLKPHWETGNAVMLVYDVSNPNSFHNLTQWYEALSTARQETGITGVVIANKTDLAERGSAVSKDYGEELAKRLGFEFFEVCAMKGMVDAPFNFLAECFHQKYEDRISELTQ